MRRVAAMALSAACVLPSSRHARPVFVQGCHADGRRVLCAGDVTAEVLCVNARNSHSGKPIRPDADSCRALGVRYADGETIWLYRASGFDPDDPPERYHRNVKVDTSHAYGLRLSPDGTLLIFGTSALRTCVHAIRNVYDLATGNLESGDLGCRQDWP